MQCRGGYHALAKDERCLCAAKGWSRPCLRWVISLGGDRGRGPVYVRSASNRIEILCTAVKDAKCHSTKSLRDSGGCGLVLRVSPEKRLLVAKEAPCLRIGPSLTSSNMVRQWCATHDRIHDDPRFRPKITITSSAKNSDRQMRSYARARQLS
jgi:hypothetical protein